MFSFLSSLWGVNMSSELGRILLSIGMAVLIGIVYKVGTHYITSNKDNHPAEKVRHKLVWFKNSLFMLLVASIVFIWISKFASVVLSLAAVAGATLIVSKELIMCALGYLALTTTRPFRIGDYITVGHYSGKVVDIDLFGTTLAQIGSAHQLNGRSLSVPNSIFLTSAVENSTATSPYIIDIYSIKLPIKTDVAIVEKLALEAATVATFEWTVQADEHFRKIEESDFVDLPSSAPKILWESVDHREIKMSIRFACPANKRVATEQEIFRLFWAEYMAHLQNQKLD